MDRFWGRFIVKATFVPQPTHWTFPTSSSKFFVGLTPISSEIVFVRAGASVLGLNRAIGNFIAVRVLRSDIIGNRVIGEVDGWMAINALQEAGRPTPQPAQPPSGWKPEYQRKRAPSSPKETDGSELPDGLDEPLSTPSQTPTSSFNWILMVGIAAIGFFLIKGFRK